jgi:intraflagellar transport protein 172
LSQDKFATKPAESGGGKGYAVRALCWSPDSTRLAVAQSDCIVFVYKLAAAPETAAEWGEKKSIVNKFLQTVREIARAREREKER